MKKLILTIMAFASIQSFAKEGQDGGGGGVISRNGQFLTFGSAGMKINVGNPQGMEQVPSLDLLLDVLDANQKGLDDKYQGQIIAALLPSESRRYFRIGVNQLNQSTYANLIAEYSKLLGGQIDPTNLAIAAITIKGDTYLLPPFFQLRAEEQAAILFHESIWIIKPDIKYDELVNAEIVMQKHIERYGTTPTYNPELVAVIGKIFGRSAIALKAALIEDLKNGVFKKYFKSKKDHKRTAQFDLTPVLGEERMYDLYYPEGKGKITVLLRQATKTYPNSNFFRVLFLTREDLNRIDMKLIAGNPSQLDIKDGCLVSTEYYWRDGEFLDIYDGGGDERSRTHEICY